MGMISRVRARLQSISTTNKLEGKPQDDRNTKTICVLSALLLVPCFARLPSIFLFGSVTAAYCALVLPLLLSGLSRRKIALLLDSYMTITRDVVICEAKKAHVFLQPFLQAKHRVEMGLIQRMGNIWNLFNQIVFFAMCDRLFCPDRTMTCLYSLMFYNVIAYCIGYVHRLMTRKRDWSPYVLISETTNVRHVAVTTTKMVLELTRAVTFLVTAAVFVSVMLGLQQRLTHYRPTWSYICVTACYYVVTEKVFSSNFHAILERMKLDVLEGLERLWAPVILKAAVCILSALMCVPLFFGGFMRLSAIGCYVNVLLTYKDFVSSSWAPLKRESASMSRFRYATREELRIADDVCAVCLTPMRFARFTPCHHMFHGNCLRLCLKASTACPMCKQEL